MKETLLFSLECSLCLQVASAGARCPYFHELRRLEGAFDALSKEILNVSLINDFATMEAL